MSSFPNLEQRRLARRAARYMLSYQHEWKKRLRRLGITHVAFCNLRILAAAICENADLITDREIIEILRMVRVVGIVRNGAYGRGEQSIRGCMYGYPFAREVMFRKNLCPASFRSPEELVYAIRRSWVNDVQSILFLVQQHSW